MVRLDYEDRYLLASILARVNRDRSPQASRYWDFREELDYRLKWDDQVRRQLRVVIEDEGFYERLLEDWTFSDLEM